MNSLGMSNLSMGSLSMSNLRLNNLELGDPRRSDWANTVDSRITIIRLFVVVVSELSRN